MNKCLIDIEVKNMGGTYTLGGSTFVTNSSGNILIGNYDLPQKMTEDIARQAIKLVQDRLAASIADEIMISSKRLFGKQSKELAQKYIKDNKDKIIEELMSEAKKDFMSRFESDD